MNLADARILHVSPAMTVIISLLSNFAFFNVEFAHSFLIMLEFTVAQFMYWTLFWLWRKLLRSRSELGGRLPGLTAESFVRLILRAARKSYGRPSEELSVGERKRTNLTSQPRI